jgi:hypothetical protein
MNKCRYTCSYKRTNRQGKAACQNADKGACKFDTVVNVNYTMCPATSPRLTDRARKVEMKRLGISETDAGSPDEYQVSCSVDSIGYAYPEPEWYGPYSSLAAHDLHRYGWKPLHWGKDRYD